MVDKTVKNLEKKLTMSDQILLKAIGTTTNEQKTRNYDHLASNEMSTTKFGMARYSKSLTRLHHPAYNAETVNGRIHGLGYDKLIPRQTNKN